MRSFVAPPPERPIFAGPPPSFSVVIPAYQARRRYLLVQLAGLGAATALLSILVSLAGLGRISAYALTIPAVTLATFTANRGWTFRSRRQASIESRTS
jgi:putative flippase GtrA